MRPRTLLSVGEFPLVGGAPCLDLVNTTGARATDSPRERLHGYNDLLVWSRRAKILKPSDVSRLREAAARRPAEAERALARVREAREHLYAVFRAIAEGGEPPLESLSRISRLWRADRGRRQLERKGRSFALRLQVSEDELDPMLWPIVTSAVDLLLSDRLRRVKRCGECDWLFVDGSKNGSRTWCKKDCGDRVRARRHYHRTSG
jgi:predicted RNA-binding Zn ribbon-like protein